MLATSGVLVSEHVLRLGLMNSDSELPRVTLTHGVVKDLINGTDYVIHKDNKWHKKRQKIKTKFKPLRHDLNKSYCGVFFSCAH